METLFFLFAALLLAVQAAADPSECQVLVSADSTSWPSQLIVPPNSTVELYCLLGESAEPFLSIDLAEDTVGSLPLSLRRDLLNQYGVFELPSVVPPTLGLLINDTDRNNQTVIECIGLRESRKTTLFVQELVQFDVAALDVEGEQSLANITWSPQNVSTNFDANRTYNLTVTSANTESRTLQVNQVYYVFEAPPNAPPCEVYNFSVTATPVGATYTGDGCSVHSPVLSRMLPSLPDITPLAQSQNFSLQKLEPRDVQVEVYFQPATYCEDYPVTNYTLECVDDSMKIQFTSEETIIVATNLSENTLYQCTLYALNSVGNVSTGYTKDIYTTDIQSVTVSEVEGSNSVMFHCDFIPGSDALGCVVIVVGEVTNTTVMVDRDDTTGVGVTRTELPLPLGCYRDVMAFDVEVDGSNGTFPVPGTLPSQPLPLDQCSTTTEELRPTRGPSSLVAGIVGAVVVLVVAIIVLICVMVCLVGRHKWQSKLSLGQITRSFSFDRTTPTNHSSIAAEALPIYALPNKNKNKKNKANGVRSVGDGAEVDLVQEPSNELLESTEQEVRDIRLIEPNELQKADVISLDPDAPELPPPFNPDTEPPPDYGDVCDDERNQNSQPDSNIVNDANTNSRAASVTPKKVNVPVYQEVSEAQQESPSTGHDGHVTSSTPLPDLSTERDDPPPGPIYQEVAEVHVQQRQTGVTPEDVAPRHESPSLTPPSQTEQTGESETSFIDGNLTEELSTSVQPESPHVLEITPRGGVPIYQEVAEIRERQSPITRVESAHRDDNSPSLSSHSPMFIEQSEPSPNNLNLSDGSASSVHSGSDSPLPPALPPKGTHVYQEVTEAQHQSNGHPHAGHMTSPSPNLATAANNSIPLEELTGPIYHEVTVQTQREQHTPINSNTNIEDSPLFAHSPLSSGPPCYRVSPILGFVDFSRTSPVSSSRSVDLMEHQRMREPVSPYRYGPPQQHSVTRSFTPRSGRAGVDEWDEFRIPAGGTLV